MRSLLFTLYASLCPFGGSSFAAESFLVRYFNVCRQQVRQGITTRYALSPTPKPDFIEPAKFARLNGYQPPAVWEKEKKKRAEAKAAP